MEWLWIAIFAVVSIWLIKIVLSGKSKPTRTTLFMRREVLFTAAERSFLGVLDQAVSGRYRVFGKVRIADVLAPVRGLDRSEWRVAFNRISAKHFDFILCDPQTLAVKAVIELNDKSHSNDRRIERDELVGRACANAGLPLRMVRAQRSYSLEAIRQIVNEIDVELIADAPTEV